MGSKDLNAKYPLWEVRRKGENAHCGENYKDNSLTLVNGSPSRD